jgi:hypothetical protein
VTRRAGRAVWLAVIAGLALRLAFGFVYWVGKPLTHDEREYLTLADSLAAGRGFAYPEPAAGQPSPERFGRAPVYPLFLAGVVAVLPGDDLSAIKFAQAIVGALGIWLIAAVASRIGGPPAAAVAAWVAAIYPPLVWTPAYVFSETLYMGLALANVEMTSRLLDQRVPRPSSLVACGALGGVAALTRPAHLFYLLLLGLYLLVRRTPAATALVAAGALLVIAPWTMRNVHEYGRFVLIASEGGITFWTGNHPAAIGEGDMAANPAIKLDNLRLRAEHPGLTSEALEPVYYREAFAAISRDPGWWLGLLVRKAFYTWAPVGPSYTLHSRRYYIASIMSYGLLLAAGLAGAAVVIARRRWPTALGLLLGSAALVCVVFFPQERFRIPVIDPALIALASGGLALVYGPSRVQQPSA